MPDTSPSSLSEIVLAAQAAPVEPATPAPTPAATETPAAPVADTDDAVAVATDDAQPDDAAAPVDAAVPDAATPPASIDWGAAMPALSAKAKELLGEDAAWLTRHGDIDGLLRAMSEREKQVGQQSVYVGAFRQLSEAGVTTDDLQRLMASKRNGQPAQTPGGNGQPPVRWKGEYLAGRDAEGKPIFNRAALARDNVNEAQAGQLLTGWQDQLADIFSSPDKVQQYIASIVDPRLGQASQQTRQELTAAQQAAQAQAAEEGAAQAWANSNATLLYANKKDVTGGVTPFFSQMQDYMKKLNPAMPWAQQLEEAKDYVLAKNRPVAATATPSDKAKRQPATGAQPVKLDPIAFHEKFGDRYEGLGMQEYLQYVSTGKVPEKRVK
jgi:hypothetical protein